MADSASFSACLALLIKLNPERLASIVSFAETSFGLGYAIGVLIVPGYWNTKITNQTLEPFQVPLLDPSYTQDGAFLCRSMWQVVWLFALRHCSLSFSHQYPMGLLRLKCTPATLEEKV